MMQIDVLTNQFICSIVNIYYAIPSNIASKIKPLNGIRVSLQTVIIEHVYRVIESPLYFVCLCYHVNDDTRCITNYKPINRMKLRICKIGSELPGGPPTCIILKFFK